MFEKIYAILLLLYPTNFLRLHGEEALRLFRDRSRDEPGTLLQMRLWIDLLYDLFISVPREHFRSRASGACALANQIGERTLRFYVVEHQAPRPQLLLAAGLLSLGLFASISSSIGQDGSEHAGAGRSWLLRSKMQTTDDASGLRRSPTKTDKKTKTQVAVREFLRQRFDQPTPEYIRTAWVPVSAGSRELSAAERQHVVDAVIKNLTQYYYDPTVAQRIADVLRAHDKRGEYDAIVEGEALANILTKQLRDLSHDMHLEVVYSERVLPNSPQQPTPAMIARYRKTVEEQNCGFEQVKVLPHNIGYLKLNAFPDPSICESTAARVMSQLNNVNAIIFDLRDNGGGSADMVSLIASYLFDHPEFLYDPRTNPTLRSWTQPRSGSRLTDKSAYVLTSALTISAAEQFTYDLKVLKRVTVVGETTRGSAHAGVFYRVNDHFGMGIPRVKAVNPFSNTDWEATGVEPDVKTKASDALQTAEKLAESRLNQSTIVR